MLGGNFELAVAPKVHFTKALIKKVTLIKKHLKVFDYIQGIVLSDQLPAGLAAYTFGVCCCWW